jgi:hypothetical protein
MFIDNLRLIVRYIFNINRLDIFLETKAIHDLVWELETI